MSKKNAVAKPQHQLSGGIEIPEPKTVTLTALEIAERFPEANVENLARAGRNQFVAAIEADMDSRGYRPEAGRRPEAEEGMKSFLDGNGRMSVLARKAKLLPDLWGKVKVEVDIYPPLTDEQRAEVIARAGRSTAPFMEADYYKQSMETWLAHPDDSYIEHLQRMGLERAFLFFSPAPESAIIRDENGGMRLKPGVKDDDLWGKNKGGQKQGPVQVGNFLAQAHPRARQAFFDQFGADPEHSISYRELIETVKHWKNDKKMRPDLATPPAAWATLVAEFPESELVNGVLGNRLANGRQVQGGREEGKGRMSAKDVEMLGNTLNFSPPATILLETVERRAGYVGLNHLKSVERLLKAIEVCTKVAPTSKENIDVILKAQETVKQESATIFKSAAAEAEAQRQKLLASEQQSEGK